MQPNRAVDEKERKKKRTGSKNKHEKGGWGWEQSKRTELEPSEGSWSSGEELSDDVVNCGGDAIPTPTPIPMLPAAPMPPVLAVVKGD